MTISNPTPHEREAKRVAEEVAKLGCWAMAAELSGRIDGRGINDDRDLREALAFVGRTPEQIDESVGRVHAAIDATSAPATGEGL